jgi:hypothetical protein
VGVNKDLDHVLVLPEDKANGDIATGFQLEVPFECYRQMQILKPAGGWLAVLSVFNSEHVNAMQAYPRRYMVLLIDSDGEKDRIDKVTAKIPTHLRDRVFILGSLVDPEALKAEIGSYETIGRALAADCRQGTSDTWNHQLLIHNQSEVERLRAMARQILFSN